MFALKVHGNPGWGKKNSIDLCERRANQRTLPPGFVHHYWLTLRPTLNVLQLAPPLLSIYPITRVARYVCFPPYPIVRVGILCYSDSPRELYSYTNNSKTHTCPYSGWKYLLPRLRLVANILYPSRTIPTKAIE